MKKVIYISLVFAYLLIGCDNTTSDKKPESNKKVNKRIKPDKNDVLSPSLSKELNSLIAYIDSVSEKNKLKTNIYLVYFSKKENTCYLTISTTHFYDSSHLSWYKIMNDKMIAFYNPENECNHDLIDTVKLKKGVPEGFSDENSKEAETIYEPYGRRYKIHNKKDVLEIVYSGAL
jgi:hypothetical protein